MNTERSGPGWIAVCECGWERFDQRRPAVDVAITKHTCPKVRAPKSTQAPAPRSSAWDDRKDSTWIDKL